MAVAGQCLLKLLRWPTSPRKGEPCGTGGGEAPSQIRPPRWRLGPRGAGQEKCDSPLGGGRGEVPQQPAPLCKRAPRLGLTPAPVGGGAGAGAGAPASLFVPRCSGSHPVPADSVTHLRLTMQWLTGRGEAPQDGDSPR